jgi:cytochrome c oxidase subunit II
MFFYGWTNYGYMRSVPRDAMEITVIARQWAWNFQYPNGKQSPDLILALERPVKLNLRSLDVIHGFFIPSFRIKEDVVPGKQNYTWFTPTRIGSFDIECTVICGVNHGNMVAKANVIPVKDFENWYFSDEQTAAAPAPSETPAPHPAVALMKGKDCLTCHTVNGRVGVGPTFQGLFGKVEKVASVKGEREVTVDENRITSAILTPSAEVVKGYPQAMPTIALSDAELKEVVEFIKTLK